MLLACGILRGAVQPQDPGSLPQALRGERDVTHETERGLTAHAHALQTRTLLLNLVLLIAVVDPRTDNRNGTCYMVTPWSNAPDRVETVLRTVRLSAVTDSTLEVQGLRTRESREEATATACASPHAGQIRVNRRRRALVPRLAAVLTFH